MKRLSLVVLAIAICFTMSCSLFKTKGEYIVFYTGTDFGLNVEADLITEKAKVVIGLKRHNGAFVHTTDNESTPSVIGLFGVRAKTGLGGGGPKAEVIDVFAIGKAADIFAETIE